MVRNLIGGCKAKRLGRKFVTAEVISDLQLASSSNELYACVNKIYGGTMSVITIQEEELLCTIRKKFKGRNKRNNLITIGSIVLVELYDWQSSIKDKTKKRKCNLVNVYDSSEYDRLLLLPHLQISRLEKYVNNTKENANENDFIFSNEEVTVETVRKQFIPIEISDTIDTINIDDI
jgi:hypothetical protein